VETLSTDNNAGTPAINLTGNELVNTLFGNAGANTLDGKAGADTMAGLGGNDFYYVDNAADRVIESAGQGTDRIFASTSYTLGAGVSVETLGTTSNAGTTAINLTGNEFANTLFGNNGANTLDGKADADIMIGLGGDDFYQVDNGADRVIEAAGEGNDQVFTSVSFTLAGGQSVEILSAAAGTSAINLTGNELVNRLEGNDGANILDGKGGSDSLMGGGGADSFVFSAPLNSGIDFFLDFTSGTDKILLDHHVFTGLPLGQLSPAAFSTSGANDADDRILYNPGLGFIAFDADGNGPGGAINFALLQPGGTVTASDFFVI
jgi:Ca2+-binding RTX toxin-like protein